MQIDFTSAWKCQLSAHTLYICIRLCVYNIGMNKQVIDTYYALCNECKYIDEASIAYHNYIIVGFIYQEGEREKK